MFDFSIEQSPNPKILAMQFRTWNLSLRSTREPMKRTVQRVFGPSFRLNFAVGGRPQWDALSEDTIRQKIKEGSARPSAPLVRTGKLSKVAGQLNIWDFSTNSAEVKRLPGAEYGGIHQAGWEPHIPQREFMALQSKDLDEMEDIFADWMIERALKAGLFGRDT